MPTHILPPHASVAPLCCHTIHKLAPLSSSVVYRQLNSSRSIKPTLISGWFRKISSTNCTAHTVQNSTHCTLHSGTDNKCLPSKPRYCGWLCAGGDLGLVWWRGGMRGVQTKSKSGKGFYILDPLSTDHTVVTICFLPWLLPARQSHGLDATPFID